MEWRPPLHLGVVIIETGAFGSPSTSVANFAYFTSIIPKKSFILCLLRYSTLIFGRKIIHSGCTSCKGRSLNFSLRNNSFNCLPVWIDSGFFYKEIISLYRQVGWLGCRIHRLHLCRGVRPPPPTSVLDMTRNNLLLRF